ncbi:class I SAM-dependent methyltransferase [Mycobacterium sp. 94-17]|uniref:class I SAM-dependent methyltransferase n=1 Tax=Mycobacterium sp. 94-17 TaxID=2986147 RepID=UPI002D1F59F1|nr:class I SAM-dependent methyltransferase [Mycobacterium sp. 94-17]MEB4209552.1 class I SAM-dependent methyltransferase [Mycobacterium sp. 94-17]
MRTDDDSWDITESVGGTAIQVAMGRMAESASANPLFHDPHAQYFVEQALERGWLPPFSEEVLAQLESNDPLALERLRAMGDYTAVRTRYFDDFFTSASSDGIDQAVILAAGLDARAWRLDWAHGSTVYEIDQPGVLAFKTHALQARDVQPASRYVPVGVDLRRDWPSALRANGFDLSRPTAWLAEGLLPYLPAAAQDRLFHDVTGLSAAGSRIAVEAFGNDFYKQESVEKRTAELGGFGCAGPAVGSHVTQTQELFYLEEHADVAEWLDDCGWQTTTVDALTMMARYGRLPSDEVKDAVIKSVFVEAQR